MYETAACSPTRARRPPYFRVARENRGRRELSRHMFVPIMPANSPHFATAFEHSISTSFETFFDFTVPTYK